MRNLLACALALTGVLVACTTKTISTTNGAAPPDPGADGGVELDPEDPANQPPHALGSIVLGESHVAGGGGKTVPLVSATFVPDAAAARACSTKLEGTCQIVPAPKCTTKPDSATGCDTGEYCTWDTSCSATCKKAVTCEKTCDSDETCKAGANGKGECVKTPTFDAGPIAFSGTTTAVTLYPPYRYEGKADGAPFLSGAELRVQAQGATEAGFEAFDESFTATTFVQTTPALNKLSTEKVFGTGPLTLGWVPGNDAIVITIAGAGGAVTCKAIDASGTFDVPRAAIAAAVGSSKPSSGSTTSSLSISVARQKKDVKKDKKTKGSLPDVEIQPEAWVELVTTSIESATFQGCAPGLTSCNASCVDLKTDSDNCGKCGTACTGGEVCGAGTCLSQEVACDACFKDSETGACKAQWDACKANASCKAYLDCASACTTDSCISQCQTKNAGAASFLPAINTCVTQACGSVCN